MSPRDCILVPLLCPSYLAWCLRLSSCVIFLYVSYLLYAILATGSRGSLSQNRYHRRLPVRRVEQKKKSHTHSHPHTLQTYTTIHNHTHDAHSTHLYTHVRARALSLSPHAMSGEHTGEQEEEEEDYMSDRFLQQLSEESPVLTYRERRRRTVLEQEARSREQLSKSEIRAREHTRRQHALHTPLMERDSEAHNPGLRLLRQMGWSAGDTLGKRARQADALTQPLSVSVRARRAGLDEETEKPMTAHQMCAEGHSHAKADRLDVVDPPLDVLSFRGRQRLLFEERKRARQLLAARHLLESCFSSSLPLPPASSSASAASTSPSSTCLSTAVSTLPASSSSTSSTVASPTTTLPPSSSTLASSTASSPRSSPASPPSPSSSRVPEAEQEQLEALLRDPVQVRAHLTQCVDRLRHTHHYCFYCAAQYDSAVQLAEYCPGLNEEDH
jgi:Domain of unknown function (DUF4187)/G-patch domain